MEQTFNQFLFVGRIKKKEFQIWPSGTVDTNTEANTVPEVNAVIRRTERGGSRAPPKKTPSPPSRIEEAFSTSRVIANYGHRTSVTQHGSS